MELNNLSRGLFDEENLLVTKGYADAMINKILDLSIDGMQLIADAIGHDSITKDSTFSDMSTIISGLKNPYEIKQIAAGNRHVLILKSDSSVWSCGTGKRLGLGQDSDVSVFTKTNMIGVKQIACSQYASYVLKNDGTIWGCGNNSQGQLDQGVVNSSQDKDVFTLMPTLNDVKEIYTGANNVFALKNDGTLWGCGENFYAQLGIGTTSSSEPNFVQIPITNVKKVAAGYNHTVVLKNDGTVWGCGYSNYGQLGTSDKEEKLEFFQLSVEDAKDIICGGYHTLILKNNGELWGAGHNTWGDIGISDKANKTKFTQIPYLDNLTIKQVVCGMYHSMILTTNGEIYVTGNNGDGQLSTEDYSNRYSFTEIKMKNIDYICAGYADSYALKNNGAIYACGSNNHGQLGLNDKEKRNYFEFVQGPASEILEFEDKPKKILCKGTTSFILTERGVLYGCGSNNYGQLGLGDTTNRFEFVRSAINVELVETSGVATYIKSDGLLLSTGLNKYGQLGLGDTKDRTEFTPVPMSSSKIIQIASGYDFVFLLTSDNKTYSCGSNANRALGINNDNTTFLSTFTEISVNVKQVACGDNHAMILKTSGEICTCGSNSYSPLGLGKTSGYVNIFTSVPNVTSVEYIACGGKTSFFIKSDGSLWSCGNNRKGQLGLPISEYPTEVNTFTQVQNPNLTNIKELICGENTTFVIREDGKMFASGMYKQNNTCTGLPNNLEEVNLFEDVLYDDFITDNFTAYLNSELTDFFQTGVLYSYINNSDKTIRIKFRNPADDSLLFEYYARPNDLVHETFRLSEPTTIYLQIYIIQDDCWQMTPSSLEEAIESLKIYKGHVSFNAYEFPETSFNNAKMVTSGSSSTLILDDNNILWGTGENSIGELGLGSANTGKSQKEPVVIKTFGIKTYKDDLCEVLNAKGLYVDYYQDFEYMINRVYQDLENPLLEEEDNNDDADMITMCRVVPVDGASYGFTNTNALSYRSTNGGVQSSASVCKLYIYNPNKKPVYLSCVSSGENNYDYGIIGKRNTELGLTYYVDSSDKILKSFKGLKDQSTIVDLPAESGWYYIKYRKDGSTNDGDDEFRFTIGMPSALDEQNEIAGLSNDIEGDDTEA
jgi:alpha-tubulin suppressor-like RCC1 family protein